MPASNSRYIMEGAQEALRLDLKTDPETLRRHALWAGVAPGMRVADLGCGPGKTSAVLNRLVQPEGSVLGIDFSEQRIAYARDHYRQPGLAFKLGDIRKPLDRHGQFDFVWVRFVLEHYRATSYQLVENIAKVVKPGGILCLVDLDYNCLSHHGMSDALEKALAGIMEVLQTRADFDPYVGRKLYSHLYDLDFQKIDVRISAHHLIFGRLGPTDAFNWGKKVELAAGSSGYPFPEFGGDFDRFLSEFRQYFSDPRRFTYTPLMVCRGVKPESGRPGDLKNSGD